MDLVHWRERSSGWGGGQYVPASITDLGEQLHFDEKKLPGRVKELRKALFFIGLTTKALRLRAGSIGKKIVVKLKCYQKNGY